MSTLYIVATPIGNLDDITLRAIKTLREADVIACEDTRHTQTLLTHLEITGLLSQGLSVAYCSDAGTPGVSDPGSRLVRAVREAGFDVVPIPGASASVTLISASGLNGKTFTFEGFLSPKSGRRKARLKELLAREEAFIIYESPFRILKTLGEIRDLDDSRHLVLGREMTKAFEQFIYGTASEVISQLKVVKGEFALVVLPTDKERADSDDDSDDFGDNR